jgi:hypothetical protein
MQTVLLSSLVMLNFMFYLLWFSTMPPIVKVPGVDSLIPMFEKTDNVLSVSKCDTKTMDVMKDILSHTNNLYFADDGNFNFKQLLIFKNATIM